MEASRAPHASLLLAALALLAPPHEAGARGFDFDPGWASRAAVAPDLDQDGTPDLVLAQSFLDYGPRRGRLVVLLGDPAVPGRWRLRAHIAVGGNPLDLVAADLDGNGLLDVATANAADGTVTVVLHTAIGAFTRTDHAGSPGAVGIAAGDLDRDGLPDLAVAGKSEAVVLFQDPGSPGAFLAPVVVAAGVSASCVAVADMDGAAGNDVVLGLYEQVGILLQDAAVAGSFPAFTPVDVPGKNLKRLVASDLDGNGRADVACAMKGEPYYGPGRGLALLLQDDAGGLVFEDSIEDEGQPLKTMEVADMDGDGTPDLLTSGGGFVLWYRQDPAARGTFERGGRRDVTASEGGIAGADFDGDGLVDAGIAYHRPYLVLQNPKGNGKFKSPRIYRESP